MAGLFNSVPQWASRHHYYHHSNPAMPDSVTFLEKCIFRPLLQKAWDTIRSTASDGDKAAAWKTINMHKIDNANMMCGRLVQDHCDRVILGDQPISESVSKMFADLHEWEPPANHPAVEKQLAIRTHREAVRYTDEGRRQTKKWATADATEMELVASNALAGLREALKQVNHLYGEDDLEGTLGSCALSYLGKPDYAGHVELKTKWDTRAHTDSPNARSLPKKVEHNHLMQVAGYYALSGLQPTVVYATRSGHAIHRPSSEELKVAVDDIVEACLRRERLLQQAETAYDLVRLTDPVWEHPYAYADFNKERYAAAREIWRG